MTNTNGRVTRAEVEAVFDQFKTVSGKSNATLHFAPRSGGFIALSGILDAEGNEAPLFNGARTSGDGFIQILNAAIETVQDYKNSLSV